MLTASFCNRSRPAARIALAALAIGAVGGAASAQVPGDCNGNGLPDPNDIASGLSADCDGNGVPDECDIAALQYSLQDGTAEASVGASGGGDFIWLSRYVVVGGNEYITQIDVAWGQTPVGVEASLAIWTDPDNDGDPNNAVLVRTVGPVVTSYTEPNSFVSFSVPSTHVGSDGDSFFVGVYINHGATHHPAALDLDSGIPSESWFAVGNNLADLSANPTPPERIEAYGLPGNWLLRCHTSNRDCNANGVFDTCDINSGTSRDFDGDSIPDECQAYFQAAVALESAVTCAELGQELAVTIRLNDAGQSVAQGQFHLSYDPAVLGFVQADPGDPNGNDPNNPFETEIAEIVDEPNGLVDYAVAVPAGQSGTTSPVPMAVLRFVTLSEVCDTAGLVSFRSASPAVDLTADTGAPMFVQTSDLPALTIDSTPPVLTPTPDTEVFVQGGVCGTTLSLSADVSDNCTPSGQIDLAWSRSDGKTTLLDSFDAINSPVVVNWQATDSCGRTANASTTVTVRVLGDLDGNLIVDLGDLAILLANYGLTAGATYDQGDFESDGDVDLGDLAILLAEYGVDCN